MKFISGEIVVNESEVEGFIDSVELANDYGEKCSNDHYKVYEQCIQYRKAKEVLAEVEKLSPVKVKLIQSKEKGLGILFYEESMNANIGPVVWMSQFVNTEVTPEEIIILGQDALLKHQEVTRKCDKQIPRTKQELLNKVFFRLVPAIPGNTVGRSYLDMAIGYHYLIGKDGEQILSFMITPHLLSELDVSESELYAAAMINTPTFFPAVSEGMREMILKFTPGAESLLPEEDFESNPMIIITNNNSLFGASVILYPDWLHKTFQRDVYILPSSVYECIVIPKESALASTTEMQKTVHEVNKEAVTEKDFLSNSVYYYDYGKNEITIIEQEGKA